jgi:hypothetical protein
MPLGPEITSSLADQEGDVTLSHIALEMDRQYVAVSGSLRSNFLISAPPLSLASLDERVTAIEESGGGGGDVTQDELDAGLATKAPNVHSHATADVTGLDAALAALATEAGLQAHIADASDAHDASAISTSAISGLSGTDVQAMLAALWTAHLAETELIVHDGSGLPAKTAGRTALFVSPTQPADGDPGEAEVGDRWLRTLSA